MYVPSFDHIIICNHFPLFATTIPPITYWHVYVGAYVNLNNENLMSLYISFIQTRWSRIVPCAPIVTWPNVRISKK